MLASGNKKKFINTMAQVESIFIFGRENFPYNFVFCVRERQYYHTKQHIAVFESRKE